MKIASKNTEMKHTLARGSAKMLRKFATTAARLNRGEGGGDDAAQGEERRDRYNQAEEP